MLSTGVEKYQSVELVVAELLNAVFEDQDLLGYRTADWRNYARCSWWTRPASFVLRTQSELTICSLLRANYTRLVIYIGPVNNSPQVQELLDELVACGKSSGGTNVSICDLPQVQKLTKALGEVSFEQVAEAWARTPHGRTWRAETQGFLRTMGVPSQS